MKKQEFIDAYIIQFLASYATVNYSEACFNGNFDNLHPVEDAIHLAERAWEAYLLLK